MLADLAALVATTIAAVASAPQLRRLIVAKDTAGVSLSFATLGLATEATWIAYAWVGGLWSAVAEPVLMVASHSAMAVLLMRSGVVPGPAVRAAALWLAVIGVVGVSAGSAGVGLVLAGAYAVQVAPSVWTAYRTHAPTGVAAWTWVFVAVEAALWGVYGCAHGDPATIGFGVVGSIAAALILARKHVTRDRLPADVTELPALACSAGRAAARPRSSYPAIVRPAAVK